MKLLLPKFAQRFLDQRASVDTSWYRYFEELTNAVNTLLGNPSTTPTTAEVPDIRISGSGWITVTGNAEQGFDVAQRPSLTTSALPEGSNLYANHSACVFDFASDADAVLDDDEWRNASLTATDSGTVLTSSRSMTFPATFPVLVFKNSTGQTLTLKKAGQPGVTVAAGALVVIAPGLTDVEKA